MNHQASLTTGQVAKHCGVNYRTVIRWIERGELKAYKLPGRGDNRVEPQDLVAFMSKHKMPIPIGLASALGRVLVVDDEQLMGKSIARVLTNAGYETEMAFNGFRAGSMLNTFHPTLMTLDLQMPGLGGMEVLDFVRKGSQFRQLKILVISAMPPAALEQALMAGADDVLAKPFDNDLLLAKVEKLIGKSPD